MLWYNIDFVICGSLKCMCTAMSYYYFFFKKEKNLILRVGRLLKKKKKVIVLLFIFEIFLGSLIFRKDKTFVLKVM